MKNKLVLTFIFFLFVTYEITGQSFYCRNYTINDGLPNNTINTLFKDSRGFLWIGTDAGAARFDGNNFNILYSLDGLAGDKIISITEDEKGFLWFACEDEGITRYNENEVKSFTTHDGLISNKITTLHYSNKFNLLCIGTENGLTIFDGNEFKSYPQNLNFPKQRFHITSFLEGENSILAFTDGNGLYHYIPSTDEFKRMPIANPLFFSSVFSSLITQKKDTIISINRKGFKFTGKDRTFINDSIGYISDFTEDSDHNIWIAANSSFNNTGGLYQFDHNNIQRYNDYLNIESNNILALEFDTEENILWIGTKENGLYLYPRNNFCYYKKEDFNIDHFLINDMYLDDSNHLWITTTKDVIEILPDKTFNIYPFSLFEKKFYQFIENEIKVKYYYLKDPTGSYEKYDRLIKKGKYPYQNPYMVMDGETQQKIPATSLYKPLKYDVLVQKSLKRLNSIQKDQNDNTWIGSNAGIFKINKQTSEIEYFDLEGIDFSGFIFGPDNELIVTSWSDLFIYNNIEKNLNHRVINYFENITPVNINKIKIHNDKIWFVSENTGLFSYENNIIKSFYNSTNDYKSFNDICFDQNGNIILGGKNGIIYISHLEKDSIVHQFNISKKNDLEGTSIRWLNCTNDNFLIAGTNSGMNIIDLNKLYQKGEVYLKKIVHSQGFTDYSGEISLIDTSGNLWIGTHNHLIQANIEKLKNNNYNNYNFYIESIEINNEHLDLSDYSNVDFWLGIPQSKIILPAHKNSITFKYDVIRFLDYDNIRFSYKLEGSNQDWSPTVKDRRAVFQNLKPGDYRFRIKIINTADFENTQELAVNFKINPPFWANWWFYIPLILFLLFLIWLIIFLRTKYIQKRERNYAEISERVAEFEMKALRSQMNPHFIFNAINSIQNYMLDNDIDSALGYLSDFAKLIRITLDNVSKKRISLDEELNYLKYYLNLEKMRFDKNFDIEIILPAEFNHRKIKIPPMIIQPFVENAIKHGFVYKKEDAKLKLEFKIVKDHILQCIIEDNGIGRSKSRELNKNNKSHQSKGIFITHERLSLLNQTQNKKGYKIQTIDLYDEYNLPCGTRVEITLPI
ncbi:MAG: histidine kinase [Bacteroidales bacterium]